MRSPFRQFPQIRAASRSPPCLRERSGGQISAKLAKPHDGGLSALPNDVLVLILQCLDTTAEAARTSVLARRWRTLWALLPELRFHLRPDGKRIRELLDVTDAPELSYISVTTKEAATDSATAWFPAAARRLAGGLVYHNMAPVQSDDEEEDAGNVQLPCFENATTIELDLRYLKLTLPPLGIFIRLTDLSLKSVQFEGPCDLSNVVSWPRCPCLQNLSVCDSWGWGLCNLSIYSESLLQMELSNCALSQLTIVTPILQKLSVYDSLPPIARDSSELVAKITAPQIVSLVWKDPYDPRHFHFGNLGQLRKLETNDFWVHGHQVFRELNLHCLRLLQQFQVLYSLHLLLVSCQDICDGQFLLGDIVLLPQITFLHLDFDNRGHAFGASLFHLLRMCIGLRRLSLLLSTFSNFEKTGRVMKLCWVTLKMYASLDCKELSMRLLLCSDFSVGPLY